MAIIATKDAYERLELNWPVAKERRSRVRFTVHLSVRFRLVCEKSLVAGAGRAVDLSSSGVLVGLGVRQPEITVGALVEMSIEWPSLLDGKVPLQLLAVGHVIRRGTFDFAATLERYEFHTGKHLSGPTERNIF